MIIDFAKGLEIFSRAWNGLSNSEICQLHDIGPYTVAF
jgi:DNA-binding CsgD family transcriptional regulator